MIPILYEDVHILAVDKPDGLASIAERTAQTEHVLGLLSQQQGRRLWVVHRLDKDVSGVMLFAKTSEAHTLLNTQFESRTIVKTYLGLVHGIPKVAQGRVDAPLRQFGSGRMGVDAVRGKPSVTTYEVKDRLANHALLELCPLTGRRHQIRVHLFNLGHPLAGDRLYGDPERQKNYPRLMLHSSEVHFQTVSGETVAVRSPLPASFREGMAACGVR